jgi:signal transduction histidine kinase
MKLGEYDKASKLIDHQQDIQIEERLCTYYYMMRYGKFGEIQNTESDNKLILILDRLNNGYISYLKSGDIGDAYISFRSAIKLAQNEDNDVLLCEALRGMLGIYERFVFSVKENTYTYFIDLHKKYAYDTYEKEFNFLYDYRIKLRSFFKTLQKEIGEKYSISNQKISGIYKNISTKLYLTNSAYHLKITKKIDSSYYYLGLAAISLRNRQDYFAKEDSLSIMIHQAALSNNQKSFDQAKESLDRININPNDGFVFVLLDMYKSFLLESVLDSLGDTKNSEKYKYLLQKSRAYSLDVENRESIFDMEVSTQIEESNKKWTNTLFYLISLFVVLSFLMLLFLKNSRKKRLIAIQEKEIEAQKRLTLLKEQEIHLINAMIDGQEKERQRVAEDLHDNLGSAIATIKLHLESLRINSKTKKKDQEVLFDKTENLINEAYQKVRSIAHAKSSGVIAKEGLLAAIKLMAQKISVANAIDIEVIHYGLEKPLDNSLEIALFRITQELTTNIIKHAQATHATINISQDEEEITLLVEDNGIGMDTNNIDFKKGMGLHSIETRVAHLGGHFTIDSTPTKGTTVIIHIPM